jgi:hypothetical protein
VRDNHICGLQGFVAAIDPPCEGCTAWRRRRDKHLTPDEWVALGTNPCANDVAAAVAEERMRCLAWVHWYVTGAAHAVVADAIIRGSKT